jgi:hypothetical protein
MDALSSWAKAAAATEAEGSAVVFSIYAMNRWNTTPTNQ